MTKMSGMYAVWVLYVPTPEMSGGHVFKWDKLSNVMQHRFFTDIRCIILVKPCRIFFGGWFHFGCHLVFSINFRNDLIYFAKVFCLPLFFCLKKDEGEQWWWKLNIFLKEENTRTSLAINDKIFFFKINEIKNKCYYSLIMNQLTMNHSTWH